MHHTHPTCSGYTILNSRQCYIFDCSVCGNVFQKLRSSFEKGKLFFAVCQKRPIVSLLLEHASRVLSKRFVCSVNSVKEK